MSTFGRNSAWTGFVEADGLVDKNATVARVRFTSRRSGKTFYATGSAKRNKGDKFVAHIGSQIAFARALRDLADQLEKEAGL